MTPPLMALVDQVRKALDGAQASPGCQCLACASDRLCASVERSMSDQRTDAAMLVGLAALQRVGGGE